MKIKIKAFINKEMVQEMSRELIMEMVKGHIKDQLLADPDTKKLINGLKREVSQMDFTVG